MRFLFLGGTQFVGHHVVGAALSRGHEVTLFHRGRTNPRSWPQAERLTGDRDGGLRPLRGRRWEMVVDCCGYLPRIVRQSAELLAGAVERYVFISTESVYEPAPGSSSQPGPAFAPGRAPAPAQDEDSALASLPDEAVEAITAETYGPLKVACERVVRQTLPGRFLIVRPGLVVGPHDHTGRFTYWPRRVAAGGEVLAPGRPDRLIQVIDGRDLGAWIVSLCEAGRTGIYNASGPAVPLAFRELLDTCRAVTGSGARFRWVPDAFLLAAGVTGDDLPLWDPETGGASADMVVDSSRAIRAGLAFRPLADTIRDTLDWDRSRPDPAPPRPVLTEKREAELLAAVRLAARGYT